MRAVIVEDSATNRRPLVVHLKSHGFETIEFANGVQAWDFLQTYGSEIDIIYSDLNMPALTGIELLTRVRGDEDLYHIPFLIVSAFYSDENRKTAQRLAASGYVEKPITSVKVYNSLAINFPHQTFKRPFAQTG